MKTIGLVPAYGRDYKSKKALLVDWHANKDFRIADISSQDDGRYANKSDLVADHYSVVKVRYGGLRKVMLINIGVES